MTTLSTVRAFGKDIVLEQVVIDGQTVYVALDAAAYADADGLPVAVSASSPMPITDTSAPFTRLDAAVKVDVDATGVQLAAARAGRTRLVMRHAGDLSSGWSLAQRVYFGWNETPTAGAAMFLDPGDVFDEYVGPGDVFHGLLDPSAAQDATQPIIVLTVGSD